MPEFQKRSQMPVSAYELFLYHKRQGAFERLVPPWEDISVLGRDGDITDGDELLMRIQKGLFGVKWLARHQDYREGESFTDVMIKGPFSKWVHKHSFLPQEQGSILEDHVVFQPPLAPLSSLIAGRYFHTTFEKMFAFRHQRTHDDLSRHLAYDGSPKSLLLVGECTSLAKDLAAFLSVGGHRVYRMLPHPKRRYVMRGFFDDEPAHPLDELDAIVLVSDTYDASEPEPFNHLEFLRSALGTIDRQTPLLLRLSMRRPDLERFTKDPVIHLEPPDDEPRLQELREASLEALEPYFQRRATLHFGCLIQQPLGYLVSLLMRLEAFLFLQDSAKSLEFAWISRDDAVGAIHHALMHDDLEGDIAAIAPKPATRADLQETLVRRSLVKYTLSRTLRVAPFSRPGRPAGMDPELWALPQITQTGFKLLHDGLPNAVRHEFGEI